MAKASGKGSSKERGKKLGVKKESVKDLEMRKGKDIKGGMFPVTDRKKY